MSDPPHRADWTADRASLEADLEYGIELCRTGQWELGLPRLARAAEAAQDRGNLPGLAYSYLGYGLAMRDHRVREGLQLCQHATKVQFYEVENFINLARTELLAGNRRGAQRAVTRGLEIDPANPELVAVEHAMGKRRPPVVTTLSRDNPVNYLLGRLRHHLGRIFDR